MRTWRVYLRSVAGQLMLFAGLFTAAAVLAVVPPFFRESFFEKSLNEKYLPLKDYAEQAAGVLASPHSDQNDREKVYDELVKRDKKVADPRKRWLNIEAIYGAWIAGEIVGDEKLLAKRLVEFQPTWVFNRLKQTFAAGSLKQRERAVAFLAAVADEKDVMEEVQTLARAAATRAERRGEVELAREARAVLERKGADHGR